MDTLYTFKVENNSRISDYVSHDLSIVNIIDNIVNFGHNWQNQRLKPQTNKKKNWADCINCRHIL